MFNFDFDFKFNFGDEAKGKAVETFEEFCKLAEYPVPYPKQIEMVKFAFPDDPALEVPREILGARGYGKTDYITILGFGFKIYKDRLTSGLLITKEFERGKEILAEIKEVLRRVGVKMKGKSERRIYTREAKGKEPTLTNLAVRSKGLRGRHPKIVLLEDMITPDDTSEAERLRVQKVYEEVLKLTPNVVVIGQPVHKLDLLQKLRFLIPCLEVKYGDIPELDVDLAAQRAAGVSEHSIAASYHLKIIDDASIPFGNVKTCNYAAQRCVAFIDPSHKGGDYTAISIGGMHFAYLIVSGFAFKKAWYDCLEELKFLFEFFGVSSIRFETNNLGDEPVNKMRMLGAPCEGYNSTDNKHSRIINAAFFSEHILLHRLAEMDRAQIMDRVGQLKEPPETMQKDFDRFMSEILQANQIFIDQTKNYEYRPAFDDAPDSLAGLTRYLGILT